MRIYLAASGVIPGCDLQAKIMFTTVAMGMSVHVCLQLVLVAPDDF